MTNNSLERKGKNKWELSIKYEGQKVLYLHTLPIYQYISGFWRKSAKFRRWFFGFGFLSILIELSRRWLGI